MNCTSTHNCLQADLPPGTGFGVWLWLELNNDHKGDYTGSDCAHHLGGATGAFADAGDLTWTTDTAGNLIIRGVVLIGGSAQVTITVPAKTGHYVEDGSQVFEVASSAIGLQGVAGTTQVQVAP